MKIYFYFVIFLIFQTVFCENFNLTIIHFNDFHARYEPINNLSTTCQEKNCFGGFSRLYSKILELRTENLNFSILLNAGDNFQGTLWYNLYKWNVTQYFLNKLPFDAITLGNHEFDDGIAGLVPYLRHIRAPVVISNIDDSREPRFQNLTRKSVIIEKQGRKIGIIGVLTTSTNSTSNTENLIFLDESESVNAEASKLQNSVFTIILLSHCGYETDLEIARKSRSRISVIVGGHTDTFLYTGSPVPGPDKPSGPYPTTVLNQNNQTVLVVQASAYTKYLGLLRVTFDEFGNIENWEGNPILLNTEISTDPDIDAELEIWKKDVDLEGGKIVGRSKYEMKKKPCRSEECLLGNFATDAMIENYRNASIAIIHAGGMRAGIEAGNITYNQLITTFPFQDTINICEIRGDHLVEIFESCIDDKHLEWPHLYQVSGLKLVFNISKPENRRVQSIEIRCTECLTPPYDNIVLEKYYRVLLPTFLTDTDFNPLFKKYIKNKRIGDRDSDVYVKYLKKYSPLAKTIEGRIKIVT